LLDEAYTISMAELSKLLKVAQGIDVASCGALCPLLKIEIFRDFMQVVGLFFSQLYAGITVGLGGIAAYFGICCQLNDS